MDSTEKLYYSKNHWCTNDKHSTIAYWKLTLPYPKNDKETNSIHNLFKSITAIAEEQDIAHFTTKNDKSLHHINEFPLFIGSQDFSTKLAYYDSKSEIVEQHIENLIHLMVEIYDLDREERYPCAIEANAITVDTGYDFGFYGSNHGYEENDSFQTYIEITTDIWLPWVYGYIHAFRPHGEELYLQPVNHPIFGMVYDNRELANYHTPRLNKFLSESYKIVSSYGGTWEITTGGSLLSVKMCSSLGVILD